MSLDLTLAYTVNGAGTYPNESYISSPIQDYFPANLGAIRYYNGLKHQKKPYKDVGNFYLNGNDFQTFFTYLVALIGQYSAYVDASQPNLFVESYPLIDFGDYTTTPQILINTSNVRQNYKNIPSEFNLFYAVLNADTQQSYGYLLYPNKLFLSAINLQKQGSNWVLTTNIGVAVSSVVGIQSNYIDLDAADYHINTYLKTPPLFYSLSACGVADTSYTLTYNLSACRTRINKPLINFTTENKPQNFTSILEPNSVLNPDSTLITFSAFCSNPSFNIIQQSLSEQQPDVWVYNQTTHFNNTSLVLSGYDISTKSPTQTFQLFQTLKQNTSSLPLIDSKNCVLSAALYLNTANIRYSNPYANSIYNVQHASNSILGIDYIADSGFFTNKKPVSSYLTIGDAITSLNKPISISNVINNQNNITWTTSYPPHYYSYKVKLADSDGKYLDSNSLNFYLYSPTLPTADNNYNINQSSYYALLSSYITSDYEAFSYGLVPTVSNDYIKYVALNLDSFIYPSLITTYGFYTSLSAGSGVKIYDLLKSPWIPLSAGDCLRIDYPYGLYGQTPITIRSSLSSNVAGQMDAFNATNFTLAPNYQQNNGFFLDLEVSTEDYNQITVNASNNVSLSSWPYIDLTNQNICLYYTSNNILSGLNISLNVVDTLGNILTSINPYQSIPFNNLTQYFNVSGYGPNTLSVYLSTSDPTVSQPTFVNTNSSLFTYFKERQFIITPSIELNNLNIDRTISLQAQLPINNVNVNVPSSYQNSIMYWTWSFDGITDPLLQPIKASYNTLSSDGITVIQNDYGFSSPGPIWLLSSINLIITPPESNDIQNLRDVVITAQSDFLNPSIIGSYTITVDDFPSANLFNADFTTVYYNSPLFTLGDTSQNLNTITRPRNIQPGTSLYYKLKPSDISLSYANSNNGTLIWYYNNTALTTINSDNSYDFDLSLSALPTIQNNVSSATIILELANSLASGWTSAHNISAVTYFYAVDPVYFSTPFQFNIFPLFGWIENDKQITILDQNNYTLIYSPSAYDNTINSVQSFYLSANKDYFTEYNYQSFTSPEIVTLSSSFGLASLGYDPESLEIFDYGLRVGLTAFNQTTYPSNMGTYYFDIDDTNNVTVKQFNITSQTLSAGTFATSLSDNNFLCAPTIIPYNDVYISFTVQNSFINLDQQNVISITQTTSTNGPAIITDGSITYYLSSQYWVENHTVPYNDGTYDLFTITVGDPFIPLHSGANGMDNFYLYAIPDVYQQIPPSVFNRAVQIQGYTGNTNIWNKVNI